MTTTKPNRLIRANSPYLLQHAHNPVDWYPWSDEAFKAASEADKPIFLSVGYAACHWCHVMERESFEDLEIASMLLRGFIAVKVDREERPDVDAIYMQAVQALTGSGGWPMSVFLTPNGEPFYGGTYFPDRPRHGLPSFRQVLTAISEAWEHRRTEVDAQATGLTAAISRSMPLRDADEIPSSYGDQPFRTLEDHSDPSWGGSRGAPKFPQPMIVSWLLRQALRGRADAEAIARRALDGMANGGIHDHVDGGFARYSTDDRWHVPHFEKMLSDNALLLQVYAEGWLLTREGRYRDVATGIAEYLLADMRLPEGGFATSQDADSDGVEGGFATWTWEELTAAVGVPVADAFGASAAGNWEGTNVLWRPESLAAVAQRHDLSARDLERAVANARPILRDIRSHRVPPATDDKVLTAWNALAIRSLCIAGMAFDERPLLEAAAECATFVWANLRRDDGRLLRVWRAGVADVLAFADDHAALGLAFEALYRATGEVVWFERAMWLADQLLELFADRAGAGFFQTGADAPALLTRAKDLTDDAAPGGNAAAAELLARLGALTGKHRYTQVAMAAIGSVLELAGRAPAAFGQTLCVADLLLGPLYEIAIVGHRNDEGFHALLREVVSARLLPNAVVAIADGSPDDGGVRVPLLEGRKAIAGVATAYVCRDFVCERPVTSATDLADLISSA